MPPAELCTGANGSSSVPELGRHETNCHGSRLCHDNEPSAFISITATYNEKQRIHVNMLPTRFPDCCNCCRAPSTPSCTELGLSSLMTFLLLGRNSSISMNSRLQICCANFSRTVGNPRAGSTTLHWRLLHIITMYSRLLLECFHRVCLFLYHSQSL